MLPSVLRDGALAVAGLQLRLEVQGLEFRVFVTVAAM